MWSIRVSMGGASRRRFRFSWVSWQTSSPWTLEAPDMPSNSVIVAGARTPIGRLLGSLSGLSAADLGAIAIKAALDRAGLRGDQVDYVIMGQVLQAGAGQIPSRQAAVKAGIPMSVPSLTINKLCLSGLDAIALAGQLIGAGEFDVVVAGGMESMTRAPHLLPGSRSGVKYGSIEVLDAMALDGLTDPFDHISMGESTDRYNAKLGISREEQDEFSARSHQRAADAIKNGRFAAEIVPVEVPQRRGDPVLFDTDEGVRPDTTTEALSRLRPALGKDGMIIGALDLIEINEAFASVAVQSMRDLGVGPEKVNVDGGAIALGHPIGMSGARLALHVVYELRRRGGGVGAAALCGGGGQGDALILHVDA